MIEIDEMMPDTMTIVAHIEREDDPLMPMCGRLKPNMILVPTPETGYERCPACLKAWDKTVPVQSRTSALMEWYDLGDQEEEVLLVDYPTLECHTTASIMDHQVTDVISNPRPAPIVHRTSLFLNILTTLSGYED